MNYSIRSFVYTHTELPLLLTPRKQDGRILQDHEAPSLRYAYALTGSSTGLLLERIFQALGGGANCGEGRGRDALETVWLRGNWNRNTMRRVRGDNGGTSGLVLLRAGCSVTY